MKQVIFWFNTPEGQLTMTVGPIFPIDSKGNVVSMLFDDEKGSRLPGFAVCLKPDKP